MSIGNYTRHTTNPAENDPLNQRVQAQLNGTFDELPDTFENWSADDVKEAVQGLFREDTNRVALDQNASAFVALHPEYLDTPENGLILNRTVKAMFGDCVHSVEQFEAAYKVCRSINLLKLNQAELAKQEKAAKQQRAEAARPVTPSEQDLYSMPLEDLRRLDATENQKRMQQRGEEGGW